MNTYSYTKTPLAVDSLEKAVRDSAIVTSLNHISALGSSVSIVFNAALSESDEAILTAVVSAHTGVPLPQNLIQSVALSVLPEPQPFAQPTYRTKRDATPTWMDCPEGADTALDFLMTQERYVSGGDMLIKDAKEGDWISAEVMDVNGVIPAPYRAALCEAHPIVASYIVRMWIEPKDGHKMFTIDTYPLNAKISAGLYLRITYHASAIAGTRKIAVNYHLTKKL